MTQLSLPYASSYYSCKQQYRGTSEQETEVLRLKYTNFAFSAKSSEEFVRFEFVFLIRYNSWHFENKSRFRLFVKTVKRTQHPDSSRQRAGFTHRQHIKSNQLITATTNTVRNLDGYIFKINALLVRAGVCSKKKMIPRKK